MAATPPPDRDTLEQAAPPGSSLDFVLRRVPAGRRNDVAAVAAFTGAVRRIPAQTQETAVARAKLHWWRSELVRILDGTGEHPLAPALQHAVTTYALPAADLRAPLDETDRRLDGELRADPHELTEWARHFGGAPLRLAARVLGATETSEPYVTSLGAAILLTRQLRLQGLAARRGHSDLPLATLESAGLSPDQPLLGADGLPADALITALKQQTADVAALFRQAITEAPRAASERQRLRPLTAYAAIHVALLREIHRRGPAELVRGRISLPPLRKAWLAWRARLSDTELASLQHGS